MPPVLRTTLPPRSPRVTLTSSPPSTRSIKASYHRSSSAPNNNNSSSSRDSPEGQSLLEQDPTPEHLQIQADSDLADSSDYEDAGVGSTTDRFGNKNKDYYFDESDPTIAAYGDSSSSMNNGPQNSSSNNGGKSCNFLWNKGRSKVSSTDIASIGNASDTDVRLQESGISAKVRALQENAKVALNRMDYKTSLALFEAILSAQVNRFGSNHAVVAAAMHNVGVCRSRMNQHELAENLLAEAVNIRKQTLGREHLEVAASLSKLGMVRVALGRFDEAFDDLRAALKIARSRDRPNQKTVAQIQCHIACLYFEKGELLAAQATFQDVIDTFRTMWSQQRKEKDSTATRNALTMQLAETLCSLGSVQIRRKRFSEAIASFQESLDLQRGMLSHDHPRIISTLDNLGFAYNKNKEYARAVTCYKNMLRSQVSHSGTFSRECLATFRKRILLYEKLKLPAQALEDTKEVLRLQKTMLAKDHPIYLESKSILEELNQKKREKRREQEQKAAKAAERAAAAAATN